MSTFSTEHRNNKVREVLRIAVKAIGPTEIARLIDEPWCVDKIEGSGSYPNSSIIVTVLRRIGARTYRGKYWLAEVES
jgi:hypothetical protein